MTINFENDNDVIVYPLEKIIDYTRKNQYIFVAQSVWWLASIISLTEGLVTHIDNLHKRSEKHQAPVQEIQQLSLARVSVTPRDLQEDSRIHSDQGYIHPDRISRVGEIAFDSSSPKISDLEPDHHLSIKELTQKPINHSRKERKAFRGKPDTLTRTRSGRVSIKPLTKKQRNQLSSIPKDMISAYLAGRK